MPFSFVHASDLRLGAPILGVADMPDELRARLLDARFSAARRVFDLALAEHVDALVLAGGVISAAAGPRAMRFLSQQFERLDRAGIDVFWCEAEADQQRWTQYVPLPGNVSLLSPELCQIFECARDGEPRALIQTPGAAPSARHHAPDLLRIGVVPRASDGGLPERTGIDYWALGGRSVAGVVPVPRGVAQFPGTTQGASPVEHGPRGCMLVRADETQRLTSRFVPTACIDWRDECVHIDQTGDWACVRDELTERARELSRVAPCDAVMVRWIIRGHGIVWRQLLREDVNAQLLKDLRDRFGRTARPVWSLFIEAVADEAQPFRQIHDADGAALSIHEPHATAGPVTGRRNTVPDRESAPARRHVEELSWLR